MEVKRRNTKQRQLVLDAVNALGGTHPTAADVYERVHMQDAHVSLGTVYRNLNLLADEGSILAVRGMGEVHFDHRLDEHSHLFCTSCGAVADVELPYDAALDARIADATGFAVHSHSLVFEGLCARCK